MSRTIAAMSVPALLLAVAPAAPVPKAPPGPQYYFPTTVGDTWVTESTQSKVVKTYLVTEVVRSTGEYRVVCDVVEVTPKQGTSKYKEENLVSEDSVSCLSSRGNRISPPWVRFKTLLKHPDGWSDVFGQWVPGKAEEIQVKAGKFIAVPVTLKASDLKGTNVVWKRWFAPNRGCVLASESMNGEPGDDVEMTAFKSGMTAATKAAVD
jgi:hypothetical protein